MKRMALAVLLTFVVVGAFAEPAKTPAWEQAKSWFKTWKEGLASSSVAHRYQGRSTTAVAAVRGDPQELSNPEKPYWKGSISSKQSKEMRKEREELSSAIDLILGGKIDDGKKALDAFETAHPKSVMLKDVQLARDHLKDAEQPAAGAPSAGKQ